MGYCVVTRGERRADDGFRAEILVDPDDWWKNLQSGECPDCGGTWVHWEAGYVPGTRRCVGQPTGYVTNPTMSDPMPEFDPAGGCGSMFTVLGARYDDDGGDDAKRRGVAVLRRERFYWDDESPLGCVLL